ncbi:MAG TPA: TraB domain-containing protein [Thermoplasmata archaeon]|nr:TraB domain-containing protein [Thermoplasmata archaeon]
MASPAEVPVLLLGSAHVLDMDAPLRRALSGRKLDGIAVELDRERAEIILQPDGGQRRSRGGPLIFRLWAMLQRRLGDALGSGVGGEMRVAAEVAREWRLPLYCIDDPIRETIARLLASLSMRERLELLVGGLVGLFLPSRVVKDQVSHYAQQPQEQLSEMRRAFPSVARVLLDERNEHMAARIERIRAEGSPRLAVVVGDAHLLGLATALLGRGLLVETLSLAQLTAPRAS